MDERLQWLMTERDLEMMTRRIQDTEMKKAWQKARQKAQKMKMENQKQDLINGVTQMEKQEEKFDLHHINKKQMMENQDRINGSKSVSEMENQEKKQIMETEMNQQGEAAAIDEAPQLPSKPIMGTSFKYRPMHWSTVSPHLIPGNPSLPWPPPEEEAPWGIAALNHDLFWDP